MAKDSISSSSSYLSAEEFLKRWDVRVVGRYISVNGTPVAEGSVANNEKFLTALKDASGEVESACLVGKRYLPEDLAALDGVSQAKLFRLIGRLAVCYLYELRMDPGVQEPTFYKQTMEDLELLRRGERVFSFQETVDSGLLEQIEINRDVVDNNLRGMTYHARRFFGRRVNRME